MIWSCFHRIHYTYPQSRGIKKNTIWVLITVWSDIFLVETYWYDDNRWLRIILWTWFWMMVRINHSVPSYHSDERIINMTRFRRMDLSQAYLAVGSFILKGNKWKEGKNKNAASYLDSWFTQNICVLCTFLVPKAGNKGVHEICYIEEGGK